MAIVKAAWRCWPCLDIFRGQDSVWGQDSVCITAFLSTWTYMNRQIIRCTVVSVGEKRKRQCSVLVIPVIPWQFWWYWWYLSYSSPVSPKLRYHHKIPYIVWRGTFGDTGDTFFWSVCNEHQTQRYRYCTVRTGTVRTYPNGELLESNIWVELVDFSESHKLPRYIRTCRTEIQ